MIAFKELYIKIKSIERSKNDLPKLQTLNKLFSFTLLKKNLKPRELFKFNQRHLRSYFTFRFYTRIQCACVSVIKPEKKRDETILYI